MKAPRPLLNASAAASFFLFLGTVPLSAAEWAFDFGTPGSRTRDGFTKVTKAQLYSRERGHGFESSEGLTGVDRSGNYPWKKGLHSSDARRRRVYGAYRVSSYSTCDFVEGRRDNAFLLNVPDGEYEVWAVVADPAHAPPFFELRANRETKHSVRMGRHGFVFVEPFRVRAEDGVLRVDLTGPHGWLLNALVVGTPGPGLQAITGDLERDIFFSYPEHLKDWVKLKQESIHPPPELTPAEEARGYVTFARDYTVKVFPFTYPERSEIDRPMTAFATPGEFEPATIAIYPFRDVGVVDVELTDFTSTDGRRISRDRVEVGIVRCWPQRRLKGSGPSGHYAIEPELIEPPCGRIRNVVAGEAKQWWFTVHVPEDAEPGQYRAQVTVKPAGAPHMQVEWRLLVLPFALARPVDRHWGTWLDTFPPLAGLRGPAARGRNTPAEVERLARLEMEDFRDHGFDVAILECSSIGVAANDDGTFSYDISRLRRQMEFLQILGKGSVVPICFEYLCRRLEYRFADESKEEHEPGTFSAKARASIVGLVQHLESERKANNWPRFLYLPIDEPGNSKTENRMTFGKNVLEMVQSVTGAQTACTITARGVRQLGDRINTRIYANGHVSREIARADAEKGFPYWYYANGIVYGASTVSSRNYTGFEFLRSGAECATGWGFASYHANP
ncbi:MAG: hypothetical protein HON70_01910, partial [Lentisphaerae bacterium]|nr:hypothetical protein [Lentisphaerota bacterium]